MSNPKINLESWYEKLRIKGAVVDARYTMMCMWRDAALKHGVGELEMVSILGRAMMLTDEEAILEHLRSFSDENKTFKLRVYELYLNTYEIQAPTREKAIDKWNEGGSEVGEAVGTPDFQEIATKYRGDRSVPEGVYSVEDADEE